MQHFVTSIWKLIVSEVLSKDIAWQGLPLRGGNDDAGGHFAAKKLRFSRYWMDVQKSDKYTLLAEITPVAVCTNVVL